MDVEALVESSYARRSRVWQLALDRLERWLDERCDALLADADRSRLTVGPGRIKELERATQKLQRRLAEAPDTELQGIEDVERLVNDLVGTKVLCKSTRDQELLAALARTEPEGPGIRLLDLADHVEEPKPSGYRAVHAHYEVDVPGKGAPVRVELQIKTRVQDAWGELTHEDLYKPGGGLKPSAFHQAVARTMANLLAEVDSLADVLAAEIESTVEDETTAEEEARAAEEAASATTRVRVESTGPRYALATDRHGQRGLIPAWAVRKAAGVRKFIRVDGYLAVGDELETSVVEDERGRFYVPAELPERDDD